MSREKFKKVQKNFSCYPPYLEMIKHVSDNIDVSETEAVEAALAFFVDCPADFQERIFEYYQIKVADFMRAFYKHETIEQLLNDAPKLEVKKNAGTKSS